MKEIYAGIQRAYAQRGAELETKRRDTEAAVRSGDACVSAQPSLDTRINAATEKWRAWQNDFRAAKAWRPWPRRKRPYNPTVSYWWYAWLHPHSVARRAMWLALWLLLALRRLFWVVAVIGVLIGLRFAIPWVFNAARELVRTLLP